MVEVLTSDQIGSALRLGDRAVIAFVGARGKASMASTVAASLGTVVTGNREDADRSIEDHPFVLVVADGPEDQPFTAPGPLEPSFPHHTTHVVACIGADAIGRCIGDRCSRPLRIAAAAECSPYQRLTPARAARVLLSERGSRKDCPPDAVFVVAITDVTVATLAAADELASAIGSRATVIAFTAVPPDGATPS